MQGMCLATAYCRVGTLFVSITSFYVYALTIEAAPDRCSLACAVGAGVHSAPDASHDGAGRAAWHPAQNSCDRPQAAHVQARDPLQSNTVLAKKSLEFGHR